MHLLLKINSGPYAGVEYAVENGQTAILGRSPGATISLSWDAFVSDQHCVLECGAAGVRVRDTHSRNGTFVNGSLVQDSELKSGDIINVGSVELGVVFGQSRSSGGLISDGTPESYAPVFTYYRSVDTPLFALADAACDKRIGSRLSAANERVRCLYDGKSASELADYAPYLIELRLPKASPLLIWLLANGYGKGWASFFTSESSFEELRRHFRKFLLVQLDDGREAYFRFYDPRVLRDFVSTCSPEELTTFFGPVLAWIVEGEDAETLLRFTCVEGKLATTVLNPVHNDLENRGCNRLAGKST